MKILVATKKGEGEPTIKEYPPTLEGVKEALTFFGSAAQQALAVQHDGGMIVPLPGSPQYFFVTDMTEWLLGMVGVEADAEEVGEAAFQAAMGSYYADLEANTD